MYFWIAFRASASKNEKSNEAVSFVLISEWPGFAEGHTLQI